MITYTLTIGSMSCYPQYDGQPDCVFNVAWIYTADDGIYKTSLNGSTNVPPPTGPDYIPYADLTEEIVTGWVMKYTPPEVWPAADVQLADWINAQYTPSVVTPPLPWSAPAAEANSRIPA